MRKILLFVLFLTINLSLVFYSNTALAEENSPETPAVVEDARPKTPKTEAVKDRIEEKKEAMEEKKDMVKERITEKKQLRIQTITQLMLRRFNAAIVRLENIISRFETRIQQIALNRDTTNAAAQLALAKSHLEMAKAVLAEVETMVEALAEAEDMKTAVVGLREKVREFKTHLMETHKALRLGVTSLKSASVSPTPTVAAAVPTAVVTQQPTEEVPVQ